MEPLSDVASVITVLQLSDNVSKYTNTVSGAGVDRKILRMQVRGCRDLLQELKDKSDDSERGKAWVATIKALEGPSADAPLARLKEILEVMKFVEGLEREKSLLLLALKNNAGRPLQELKRTTKDNVSRSNSESHALSASFSTVQSSQIVIRSGIDHLKERQEDAATTTKGAKILDWLSHMDPNARQLDTIKRRSSGTGTWLLTSNAYQKWIETPGKTLFCPGIHGAGKTVMTSIVISALWELYCTDSTVGLAFVYCDYNCSDEQTLEKLLRSLLKQLVERQISLSSDVEQFHRKYNGALEGPMATDVSRKLQTVEDSYQRVFILIDALDECQPTSHCVRKFLSELFGLQNSRPVNLWATSRPIPEIEEEFTNAEKLKICAHREDVGKYLHSQMDSLPKSVRSSPDYQEEITIRILDSIGEM
ncbi:hypothetical protein BU23DRAFT_661486 [Bimuria novae-zelandiae CBS 107.79]|uniref:Nephrocystin 3-like N-terminal domain-containing protein n=1 Tax=Bimuria novae-zelandiae CBS 107.79 TaxID=1447943 RepID=A0A6A5UQR3_9PLEO|nr:hypothetical protein BU23DRAFT_661486 [Bimuria novae-zelandiae CBS 107.79]